MTRRFSSGVPKLIRICSESPYPVIDLMPSQKGVIDRGGTMRLGAFECMVRPGTRAAEAYGTAGVWERHRHRYEFNSAFKERFEAGGMKVGGESPDGLLAEILEIPSHPWFVGCQFHPEFKSRPMNAHPLFRSFVAAAVRSKMERPEGAKPRAGKSS